MTPLLAYRRRAERAFERLYRRHVGDVYRFALVLLRNPEDAEDVTQTTFLNAYRAYARGERPDSSHAWLISITHDVCRQRLRLATRMPIEVDLDEDEDYAVEVVPEESTPGAAQIRRALEHLPFNQRAALVMRELEGRPYAEIADVLSLSVTEVETLLFRARRALREQLEGRLTCHDAERAISRQMDGLLSRSERGALRAHLRTCEDCTCFAQSMHRQRAAWKALAALPLPSSLASFFGPQGVARRAGDPKARDGGAVTGIAAKSATR